MPLTARKPNANQDFIHIARQVINQEAQALQDLSACLDEGFNELIQIVKNTQGRVVVSGMGKSGLIGKKIASTLSSTGQPAIFVHPAEAGHGDLGMITTMDTLLLLSNSGETTELSNLIAYARRFSIPIVAITSNKGSTLAHLSSATLVLPKVEEACPMGLTPTTSTTLMLALGDAVAIALLTARGFTNQDFHLFHPGGNLGTQLKRVSQIMHQGVDLPLVQPNDVMADVLLVMSAKGYGCVGILDESQHLKGMITDGDLRRHMHKDLLARKAHEVMTQNPKVVETDMLLAEASAFMSQHTITCVFVVNDKQQVKGLLHIHDLFRAGVL